MYDRNGDGIISPDEWYNGDSYEIGATSLRRVMSVEAKKSMQIRMDRKVQAAKSDAVVSWREIRQVPQLLMYN